VYTAPSVKPGYFLYFDPIDTLAPDIQAKWREPLAQQRMIDDAVAAARAAQAGHARASSVTPR
jgi:lysine 2,3-aminomutase